MSKPLTIGQVAAATGVTTHTLRYYEQAGLLRAIGRTQAGHRLYSPADRDWLQFVMRLKATGMPIASIQAFSELRAQGEATYDARREMLAAHRNEVLARIDDLQANLAAITDKIAWYETAARDAARHDEDAQTHRQEEDSPWISEPTQSPTSATRSATTSKTAMRKAGKS
ncbi:DNA-binding transcriptional MerR regulator [Paraburkholderia bannensis]|uniref:DNA-binding transcriptional MerR regulator n=1 Tax=Paraburkholderia bannensis TaxID=765414 RepID=A0A7W9U131_9BURK|nr:MULTISPECIES: MerR family transcriptional regulator [Paraburkholderia]MBB3260300.1 DNA-binding transcriptional MerR regulator [Paraburkholderia sp. WP4_3_2]MBB6105112.1 DNA-binding transcriptional MerR regulator [Paraburkholderia bannensis]